jgi:lysophospholipase L1-like esterase
MVSCEYKEREGYFDADDPKIQYTGRFDFSNPDEARFDWSGVQIAANFSGTSCTIILEDGENDYNIFIDHKLHSILRTTSDTLYTLAADLEDTTHSLLITRRTEASFGIATVKGLILEPGKSLLPIKEKNKRKIEFIGDSFVAGFGSEGKSPDCLFSRETENNYISYGPVLARRLQADYSIVAISGTGVIRNYGDSLRTSHLPLPYYYDKTCMNDTIEWDFTKWQPDVVVLRLGRNDYWKKPFPKRDQFRTAYINFLQQIRTNYPAAQIFALCGPIRKDPHCDYIRNGVNELKNKLNDKKIHFVKLDIKFDPKKDFGCQKHPNESGHKKIADALEPIFKKVLRW